MLEKIFNGYSNFNWNKFIICMLLFFILVSCVRSTFNIILSPNSTGKGSMNVIWDFMNISEKFFKLYRSKDNLTFTQLPIDYSCVNKIKCLQIYPNSSFSNQLTNWIVKTRFGLDKIEVSSVSIDSFNKNPDQYLLLNNEYQYDILYFGSCDDNNNKDLNSISTSRVQQFINSGRGVIFGHDTIIKLLPYFTQFCSYLNIIVQATNSTYSLSFLSTKVKIVKSDITTQYPHNIGNEGTVFDVKQTHTTAQILTTLNNANLFLQYDDGKQRNLNQTFYLTTKNNVAMIQTGHSKGEANEIEQKIIANLIFSLNMLISNITENIDRGAIDTTSPVAPSISLTSTGYQLNSIDQGTEYFYYLECYQKDDLSTPYDQSVVTSQTVVTGISHYLYVYDKIPNTVVTQSNGLVHNSTSLPFFAPRRTKTFLHVAAVDFNGNISPTTTIEISNHQTCLSKRHSVSNILLHVLY